MVFLKREHLSVIELDNLAEEVSFDVIRQLMLDRPTNVFYCECKGILYGLISAGDIARAYEKGKNVVLVNRRFTYISEGGYMLAREIFREQNLINAIPIVNKYGMLDGAYIRWDDLKSLECMFFEGKDIEIQLMKGKVALVYPHILIRKKQKLLENFGDRLQLQGIEVKYIKTSDIFDVIKKVDWILFVDEDEKRGTDVLFRCLLNADLDRTKFGTYEKFIHRNNIKAETIKLDCEKIGNYLSRLKAKGIRILNLVFSDSFYMQDLREKIRNKYSAIGKMPSSELPSSMWSGFFSDLYTKDYAEHILQMPIQTECAMGICRL